MSEYIIMSKETIRKQLLSTGIEQVENLPYPSEVDTVGKFNGFYVYYDSSNEEWVVTGRVPMSIVKQLNNGLYPNEMSPFGVNKDFQPIEMAKSDEYDRFVEDYLDNNDIFKDISLHSRVMQDKKTELFHSKYEDFFVDRYSVNNIKALNFFIRTIKENNISNNSFK